jgi:hypothetical protein
MHARLEGPVVQEAPVRGLRVVRARDWRRVLFEALQAPNVPVVLSAVTPRGADKLPWDEWHCLRFGEHRHSARLGSGSRARR